MDVIVRGKMFHGGVFSGNAIVMSAVEAMLDEVTENRVAMYAHLEATGHALAAGLDEILMELDVPHVVHNVGAMVSLFLTDEPDVEISSYRDVRRHGEFESYIELQHELQRSGVFFHPNMFEPMYVSTAHTSEDVTLVLERAEVAAKECLAR